MKKEKCIFKHSEKKKRSLQNEKVKKKNEARWSEGLAENGQRIVKSERMDERILKRSLEK